MKRTRTTRTVELKIERSEFFVHRNHIGSIFEWCDGCCRQVSFVTPGEAAQASGTSEREVYRWIESEEIHFVEMPEGTLLVCLNWLRRKRL